VSAPSWCRISASGDGISASGDGISTSEDGITQARTLVPLM